MQFKKLLTLALGCFIIVTISGITYADNRNDNKHKKTKKYTTQKNKINKHSKRRHDTHKRRVTRTPDHYANPNRHNYYQRPSRLDYNYRYNDQRRRYSNSNRYYNNRPKVERYYRHGKPHRKAIVIPSRRQHDHYIVTKPFRHSYRHYKPMYYDNKLWGWLAFTLITLQIFDHLDNDQRQEHEYALHRATTTSIGKSVVWSDNEDISGSVTPVWEGPNENGRYCREFRHEISIDDQTEIAYGTACQIADGSWEVVQ